MAEETLLYEMEVKSPDPNAEVEPVRSKHGEWIHQDDLIKTLDKAEKYFDDQVYAQGDNPCPSYVIEKIKKELGLE